MVNRVEIVSRKKNLLLNFDNFEEGAELTTTVCVSYFAATLPRYVRVSARLCVAFHEGSFQMNCLLSGMILFMAHKSLVDCQQLKLFFPILKQRVHLI